MTTTTTTTTTAGTLSLPTPLEMIVALRQGRPSDGTINKLYRLRRTWLEGAREGVTAEGLAYALHVQILTDIAAHDAHDALYPHDPHDHRSEETRDARLSEWNTAQRILTTYLSTS